MKIEGLQIISIGVFLAAIVVIIALNLYFGPRITISEMPMQWGLDGNPIWYAPRLLGLWWPLYLMISVGLGIIVIGHFARNAGGVWYGLMAFSLILAAVQWWHLGAVIRWAMKQ